MTGVATKKTTAKDLAEIYHLFGPAPVLSSEDPKAYDGILLGMIQCLKPMDFFATMIVKRMADEAWEIRRYSHHKKLAIDRKLSEHVEIQAQRDKLAAQKKQERDSAAVERAATPPTQFDRIYDKKENALEMVEAIDEILDRTKAELAHARALESAFSYYEKLDTMRTISLGRQNNDLNQLERYLDGLGRMTTNTNQIIDKSDDEPKHFSAPSIEPTH